MVRIRWLIIDGLLVWWIRLRENLLTLVLEGFEHYPPAALHSLMEE